MENNKYFKQFVDRLDVNQKALDTLKQNEINKIEVELELLGLTLKGSL